MLRCFAWPMRCKQCQVHGSTHHAAATSFPVELVCNPRMQVAVAFELDVCGCVDREMHCTTVRPVLRRLKLARQSHDGGVTITLALNAEGAIWIVVRPPDGIAERLRSVPARLKQLSVSPTDAHFHNAADQKEAMRTAAYSGLRSFCS